MVIESQFDFAFNFSGGLAAVRQEDKWGYINKTGKFVIRPMYDFCKNFSDGLAIVQAGKYKGYINKEGVI